MEPMRPAEEVISLIEHVPNLGRRQRPPRAGRECWHRSRRRAVGPQSARQLRQMQAGQFAPEGRPALLRTASDRSQIRCTGQWTAKTSWVARGCNAHEVIECRCKFGYQMETKFHWRAVSCTVVSS